MDLIFKIAAIGIIVAILHTLIKQSGRDEYALMVSISGLIVVLLIMAKEIYGLFETLKSLFKL